MIWVTLILVAITGLTVMPPIADAKGLRPAMRKHPWAFVLAGVLVAAALILAVVSE